MKFSTPDEIRNLLLQQYPRLNSCTSEMQAAFQMLSASFREGGKLLLCGNGGSAADCEHIAGELMKGFLLKRPLPDETKAALCAFGEQGAALASQLQGALPCIPLTGCIALSTAFANDVDPYLIFAQQVYGYGRAGDVLLALSTSGNAKNVAAAVTVAKVLGMHTIGLTGASGGRLRDICDVTICAPESETYRIQEYHIAIYHALCAMLELEFFRE